MISILNGRDIADITSEIVVRYDECAIIAEDIFDDFSHYERIQDNVVFHVVNTEMNRERIANAPSIPFLDLSVVFYVVMNDAFQSGEVMIDNTHLAVWENVDTERLMIDAARNTPRLFPYRLCGLLDQCLDLNNPEHGEFTLTNEALLDHIFKTPDIENDPSESMLILTTAGLTSGACTLLYNSILAKIADAFDRDLIIIPSSVNELIVLPKIDGTDINGINETVREVNESHVDPVEVLSDHVYEFRRSMQCVTY